MVDDEVPKGIKIPEMISAEVRAATRQRLNETFAGFREAAADLEGRPTRDFAKGVQSETFRSQAAAIDPDQAMLDKVQAMLDDLLTVDVLDGLNAIKLHDDHTFEHSINVTVTSLLIGRQLKLNDSELRVLGLGALVHDVGKMFVDRAIIQKPAKLTKGELAKVKAHSRLGYLRLRQCGAGGDLLAHHVAYQHRERQDGRGYPRGLSGSNQVFRSKRTRHTGNYITLNAEIAAVANVYDAITSPRPYRPAYQREQAGPILRQAAGTNCARQAPAEWLRRELHRPAAR
ncbi:MAG: HD domain-containing protein [Actinobacteria bacterium]|nr:HD domain-containing protein [Actinomycetota bacterium]